MRADLVPGNPFPELELPDHSGVPRTLTELAEGDPVVLTSTAGGAPRSRRSSARWCGCRRSWRSPTRGWCRSASTRRPSRPPSGPVSAPVDLPVRPGAQVRRRARPAGDDRHALPAVPADRVHAVPGPDHPLRLQRLLVLGAPDQRGPPAGPASGLVRVQRGPLAARRSRPGRRRAGPGPAGTGPATPRGPLDRVVDRSRTSTRLTPAPPSRGAGPVVSIVDRTPAATPTSAPSWRRSASAS